MIYTVIGKVVGDSAYDIAVKHGYEGTEEEWIKQQRSHSGLEDLDYESSRHVGFASQVDLDDIDERVEKKAFMPIYDKENYILTFENEFGDKIVINLPLERIALDYDVEQQSIYFTNSAGEIVNIPVSELVTQYTGGNNEYIITEIDSDGVVMATLKPKFFDEYYNADKVDELLRVIEDDIIVLKQEQDDVNTRVRGDLNTLFQQDEDLNTKVDNLSSDLNEKINVLTQSDEIIKGRLDITESDIQGLKDKDVEITNLLEQEVEDRKAADTTINERLDGHDVSIEELIEADSKLDERLNVESIERITDIEILTNNLSEFSNRVTDVETSLLRETETREREVQEIKEEVAELKSQSDGLEASIANEVTAREEAIKSVNNEIDSLKTDVESIDVQYEDGDKEFTFTNIKGEQTTIPIGSGGGGGHDYTGGTTDDIAVSISDEYEITANITSGFVESVHLYVEEKVEEKQDKITGAASTITDNDLTASKVLVTDENGKVATSTVGASNMSYLTNVTSDIQNQLDSKMEKIVTSPETDSSKSIKPNILYVWGTMASLTITFEAPESTDVVNEYMFQFKSGSTATNLIMPSNIVWVEPYTIEKDKTYEVSVISGLGIIAGW